MATVLTCDRCGKKIEPRYIVSRNGFQRDISTYQCLEKYGIAHRKYDLCYDCYKQLKGFLEGGVRDAP